MKRLLLFALLVPACFFTFDDDAPTLPLIGNAPGTASLPHLNHSPAGGVSIIYGADNVPWAEFSETLDTDKGPMKGLRFVRLVDPVREETLIADDDVLPVYNAYYNLQRDKTGMPPAPTKLTIHFVGATTPDPMFELPSGAGVIFPENSNSVFIYWPIHKGNQTFLVQHVSGGAPRMVPLPDGLDPDDPFKTGGGVFFLDAAHYITRDATDHLVKHAVDSDEFLQLGVRPHQLAVDQVRNAMVTCGADGVRSVPLDGALETVLDPAPCDENGALWFHRGRALYGAEGNLRWVPLDGSEASSVVLPKGRRVIAFGPKDDIVYSTDPSDEYVQGAGNGWLGGWKFMDRGRSVSYASDGKRLRWLEHAAQPSGVGDLVSALVPDGTPLYLARNVRQYEVLPDGRLLANANRAFRGVQNRVITIDEEARVAHWVADQAADFVRIPGTKDVLIDVVSGATGFDIVRVPIPPK